MSLITYQIITLMAARMLLDCFHHNHHIATASFTNDQHTMVSQFIKPVDVEWSLPRCLKDPVSAAVIYRTGALTGCTCLGTNGISGHREIERLINQKIELGGAVAPLCPLSFSWETSADRSLGRWLQTGAPPWPYAYIVDQFSTSKRSREFM